MINSSKKMGTAVVQATTVVSPINDNEYKDALTARIYPVSTTKLARATKRTKDAVKLWKNGQRVPNGASLINLARQIPEVRAWLLAQIDPSFIDDDRATRLITAAMHELSKSKGG